MRCVVTTCKNYQAAKKKSVTFHCFPKDYLRVKAWLEASGDYYEDIDAVVNFILKSKEGRDLRICSEHFTPDCFYTTDTNKRFLYTGAVPLIFLKAHWVSRVLEVRYKAASSANVSDSGTCSSFAVDESQAASSASGCTVAAWFRDHDYTSNLRYKLTSSKFCSSGTQTIIETSNKCVSTRKSSSQRTISTQTDWPRQKNAATTTLDLLKKSDVWTWTGVSEDKVEMSRFDTDNKTTTISHKESMCLGEPHVVAAASPHATMNITTPTRRFQSECEVSSRIPRLSFVFVDLEANTTVHDYSLRDPGSVPHPEKGESFTTRPCEEDYVSEKKFIVFESCLDKLLCAFKKCTYHIACDAPIAETEKSITGSLLTVYTKCENNHRCLLWRSQPMIGRRSCGNILASAAVLLSGSHFSKVSDFFRFFGVPFISESVHYVYQKKFLFPIVDVFHARDRKAILKSLNEKALCLLGNSQCDSSGFSAKYCTYALFEEESKKIIDFCIIQDSEARSSVGMEKKAFRRCMDKLIGEDLQIGIVSTVRHVGIQKVMRENFSTIKHQFDAWYYCKCLRSKLVSISKSLLYQELAPWTSAIVNHLWMSCCMCQGDVERLRERWRSILHHVSNEHAWESDGVLKSCDHVPIMEPENRSWLVKDTPPYLKLSELVTDVQLDKDLPHLADYCHNGDMEDYHNMVMNYRPKGIHFSMDCMVARTKLAVLAHNALGCKPTHLCPPQGSGGDGPHGHQPPFSKRRKKTHRNVNESVLPDHLFLMLADVLRLASKEPEVTWMPKGTFLPPNMYTPSPH
uniref:THAP-type domain-containing protein n=1 Tax=Leptobrachium leishanense TaxID=445787 RepID=A0A8C5MQ62_9ANUR